MGDQHQGAGEALQVALQPLDAIGIEVVGGFIQQQHIRLGHQGRGQGQSLAVATGEIPHAAIHIADAEPIEHLADLLLKAPGLALIHAGVEAAELGQQGPIVCAAVAALGVGLGEGLAHLRVAAQQLHLLAAVCEHLLEHGALRIDLRLLAHQHHPRLGRQPPLPLPRRLLAGQQAQQGGLAGAVRADQPQPVALLHVQGELVEQGANAEVLADLHQADQAHALEGRR